MAFNVKKIIGEKSETITDVIDVSVRAEQNLISCIHLLESIIENPESDFSENILKELSKYDYRPSKNVMVNIGVVEDVFVSAELIGYEDGKVKVRETDSDNEYLTLFSDISFNQQG